MLRGGVPVSHKTTFAHQGEKKPLFQGALGTAKPCQSFDKIHLVALSVKPKVKSI
jgi:hypothetical protein